MPVYSIKTFTVLMIKISSFSGWFLIHLSHWIPLNNTFLKSLEFTVTSFEYCHKCCDHGNKSKACRGIVCSYIPSKWPWWAPGSSMGNVNYTFGFPQWVQSESFCVWKQLTTISVCIPVTPLPEYALLFDNLLIKLK